MKNTIKKLSVISLLLTLALTLSSCSDTNAKKDEQDTARRQVALLEQCEDLGQDYIDSFIFFGESTTYHLKSRGVLKDGKNTTQVWGTRSGTAQLDLGISTLKVVYPRTNEELTLSEALGREAPQRILFTFGLNGAVSKIKQGEEYFAACYTELIDLVRASSPQTQIFLQSCFPVSEEMDTTAYGVSAEVLNGYIRKINEWTLSLAEREGVFFLNSYEVMANENGALKVEFAAPDGYHLTRAAYEEMLLYLRTHSCEVTK